MNLKLKKYQIIKNKLIKKKIKTYKRIRDLQKLIMILDLVNPLKKYLKLK